MITTSTHQRTLQLLNPTQKESYLRDGFLVIRNFIETGICEWLIQRAQNLIANFDPTEIKTVFSTKDQRHAKQNYFLDSGDQIRFFLEEGAIDTEGNLTREKSLSINKIGHALHDLDPIFNCFSRQHKIAALAQDLDLHHALLVQSMYICKQPHIGGEVNCHQDSSYLFTKKQPVVGLWFALEDATLENGCLWAIPGGHREKLKSRFIRQGSETRLDTYDNSLWPLDQMVPLEVPAGSVIVLHGLLPHMSKENISARSRHAYALHLISENAEFAPDNWLQRKEFKGFL